MIKKKKIINDLRILLIKFFKKRGKIFSMEKIDNWDSLNHLRLVSEIEKKFQIKISSLEASKITDESKIVKLLKRKKK